MSDKRTVLADLLHAIQQTARSAQFSDAGTIDAQDLSLEIEEIGEVKLPLRPKSVREIISAAETAPFGKGAKTIIDRSVRDSLEIQGSKIQLPDAWRAAVQSAAQSAAARLGLPADRIQVQLYKLLIYPKGGFFLPHRDSEKRKNMLGSLVVMLPSSFGGGELVITHGNSKKTFSFEKAARGEAAEYVAFYADCEHEVRRVTRGVRVCLAYNLILKPSRNKRPAAVAPDPALKAALAHWTETRPRDPLVFALEHQYTASGLKPSLLKGNDREAVRHLSAAARAADCRLYFGQVSLHLLQFADDGSWGRERRSSPRPVELSELRIGETYEDELVIEQWKDIEGKPVAMGELPLDSSMLVSPVPLEQWQPTSQDYEGYTGNAGNSLSRWYHKSAAVLWSSRHHFDVLVRMGLQPAVETLAKMREALAVLPDSDREQAREDCKMLTRAIIEAWPQRLSDDAMSNEADSPWLASFAADLPKFEAPDLVGTFLQVVANRDWELDLFPLIKEAYQRFDADAMTALLVSFLSTPPIPNQYGHLRTEGLAARDASWLRQFACDRTPGGITSEQLSRLLRLATRRLQTKLDQNTSRFRSRAGEFDDVLKDLLKAALAIGDETLFGELLQLKRSSSQFFELRRFDVSTCTELVKWASKRFGQSSARLAAWLTEIREFLEAQANQTPLAPPDFARPSEISCRCQHCRRLSEFLSDPTREAGEIKALKHDLEHVQQQIQHDRLDANSKLDRTTRPFTLLLTKTTGSHQRAVEQYETDKKLLRSLPRA